VKFYREALAASPREPDLHRALGRTLLDEQKYAAAETEFRAALKLDPHHLEAAKGLATSLYFQERYAEAIPVLEAVARAPGPPVILFFTLASCYDHLRDRPNALKNYEHFLELSHGSNPTQDWQAEQRAKLLRRESQK
jgi:tetratricopeptide (TPR) repeat protein